MADEQRMLRRGLMRMLQRGLAQAYEGWRSYLQMVNENKATMMHFVNRMMQRQLSKAFESWQARTEEVLIDVDLLIDVELLIDVDLLIDVELRTEAYFDHCP